MYSKKDLTERDICTKYITPALVRSGWDFQLQILEEFSFTHGRIYVKGKLTARVLLTREMYFDAQGKPITVSLKDYTREKVKKQFSSLDDFLTTWNNADREEAIVKELEAQGVLVDALENAVNKELELFNLICHTAFDTPPLTRKERVNNVKKQNYFTRYGETA